MNYSIDIAIVVGFLLINLVIGINHGKGVKNIKDYALGGGISTAALISTTVATWIGGDYLFITVTEVYTTGLHYAIACCGMVLCFWITAFIFIPKMSQFLGSLSVAEAIGNLYGMEARLVCAIAGTLANAGFIAVQFKVFSSVFNYVLGIPETYGIVISAIIVTAYSAYGGVKSVVFTDIFQFFTFGVLVPLLGIIIWHHTKGVADINRVLAEPLFNWREFIGLENPSFWKLLSLFLIFAIPDFSPPIFQRIAMGRDIKQVKQAFIISGFLLLAILLGMSWIGFLLYSVDPTLNPDDLINHIISSYAHFGGFEAVVLVGIMAMSMSTADSSLNSSAVLVVHDILHPLNLKPKKELLLLKWITVFLGIGAIFLALSKRGLLDLVLTAQSFYMPAEIPLILAILGFKTAKESALIGMAAGMCCVLGFMFYGNTAGSLLPAMITSAIFIFVSHYVFGLKKVEQKV